MLNAVVTNLPTYICILMCDVNCRLVLYIFAESSSAMHAARWRHSGSQVLYRRSPDRPAGWRLRESNYCLNISKYLSSITITCLNICVQWVHDLMQSVSWVNRTDTFQLIVWSLNFSEELNNRLSSMQFRISPHIAPVRRCSGLVPVVKHMGLDLFLCKCQNYFRALPDVPTCNSRFYLQQNFQ